MDSLLRTNAISRLQVAEVPRNLALALIRYCPLKKLTIWHSTIVDLILVATQLVHHMG